MKLQYLDVLGPKDIEAAFQAAVKERSDAVLMYVSGGIMSFSEKSLENSR